MHLIVGPTMQKDVCSSCDPLDSSPLQLPGIVSGQTRSWNQSTVWVWQIHRLKGISSREFWAPQFSKGWGCCFFLLSNGLSGATDSQHEQLRRHAAGTLFFGIPGTEGVLGPWKPGWGWYRPRCPSLTDGSSHVKPFEELLEGLEAMCTEGQ
jgi:hypothetical protein